jgi:hypothetical protein
LHNKQTVDDIISLIYNNNTELPITEYEIAKLQDCYKKHFQKSKTYNDFLYENPEIPQIIGKVRNGSARYEIEKQFANKKALQPGILAECVYSQCLANLLDLHTCLDLDLTSFNLVPSQVGKFIQQSSKYFSAARYLYYGDYNDRYLIQYGNPEAGDARIVYCNNEVIIEFKENKAKAGEYDLLCDENGKLIVPQNAVDKTSHLQWCIDYFNQDFNIFDILGSNKKLENVAKMKDSIVTYFEKNKIDLLISSVNNELIAIKPEDIVLQVNDHSIIETSGSEIRTTGRNKTSLFTPDTFFKLLKNEGATISNNKIITMPQLNNNAYGFIQERGKEKGSYRYYKLAYSFCVLIKNIEFHDGLITFSIDNVLQKKPTISPHITITTTKTELSNTIYNSYIQSTVSNSKV